MRRSVDAQGALDALRHLAIIKAAFGTPEETRKYRMALLAIATSPFEAARQEAWEIVNQAADEA